MKTKIVVAVAAVAGLLACSTPHTAQIPQPAASSPLLLAPSQQYELRDDQLGPRVSESGQICKLGTSCFAMDPRPFEPCLLSTKRCSDKAGEPLLTAPAPSIDPTPQKASR